MGCLTSFRVLHILAPHALLQLAEQAAALSDFTVTEDPGLSR